MVPWTVVGIVCMLVSTASSLSQPNTHHPNNYQPHEHPNPHNPTSTSTSTPTSKPTIKNPPLLRVNRALRSTHSRRETNTFIADGRIRVNDIIVSNPNQRLQPSDVVSFDDHPIPWKSHELDAHVYLKFHKPRGVVCTMDRRVSGNIGIVLDGTEWGVDVNTDGSSRRVYPIGRLDADSTGLILLTSDGSIINPLLRSKSKPEVSSDHSQAAQEKTKEYIVSTHPVATLDQIAVLAAGVMITTPSRKDGKMVDVTARTLPCVVERVPVAPSSTPNEVDATTIITQQNMRFLLKEGRNRQIRRMCASLGLEVTHLHRVSFAGVSLEGCEGVGEWAVLTNAEEIGIGARALPTREEKRTPQERAERKAKKRAKRMRSW